MCGIFGVAGQEEAAHMTYLGLYALQNRGEEGTGIVSTDGVEHFQHRGKGLVSEVFRDSVLGGLRGSAAIGHNRYGTSGPTSVENIQPFSMRTGKGVVAVAHNGHLTNAEELTHRLHTVGSIFQSTSDTEVILHLLAREWAKDVGESLAATLRQVQGSYGLLVLAADRLIAVRDPSGLRPLVMGSLGGSPVFSSETTAFDLIGATYVREVEPGEMLTVNLADLSVRSERPFTAKPLTRCVFEHVYFSRPDGSTYGADVHEVRRSLGRRLAREHPATADLVIPVPDSGIPAALGYAQESGIPFDMGIIRSHYVGRTFLKPKQDLRDLSVRLKLSGVRSSLDGRRVVVVDDSLVRGTTSKKIIRMLRERGAREVHLRVSAPPTVKPCYYGIDTPTREELLAAHSTVEEVRQFVGADSLGYLSRDGLLGVCSSFSGDGFCSACFGGDYPTHISVRRKG